ncbi:MAG: 50S ribosomal protein L17 [Candidatus Nealsonbacteria bacterium]|nr:50S ribosomal protein L17 [Candidatus Nealsonbacteria bacterium]
MWKQKKGRKFSRKTDQRKALLRSLAEALFIKEKIRTTEAKAKETAIFAEKLITQAKKGDLSASRYLAAYFNKDLVKKIMKETAPRFKERKGGYTRVTKLEPRKTDAARMAIVELIK